MMDRIEEQEKKISALKGRVTRLSNLITKKSEVKMQVDEFIKHAFQQHQWRRKSLDDMDNELQNLITLYNGLASTVQKLKRESMMRKNKETLNDD